MTTTQDLLDSTVWSVCMCSIPCLSSKVAQRRWILGLCVRWISQARFKTARASSTLCASRYSVYWTHRIHTNQTLIQTMMSTWCCVMCPINMDPTLKCCSHPGPELFIQSTGDEAALKEDANPVVVMGNHSIFWLSLRLGYNLWPLCGFLAWIYWETIRGGLKTWFKLSETAWWRVSAPHRTDLYYEVTLVGFLGVGAQLSDLPVQVGVPSTQLEAVEWLDVEVRPFDLQSRRPSCPRPEVKERILSISNCNTWAHFINLYQQP